MIIPKRLGNLHFENNQPVNKPNNKIIAILVNIYISHNTNRIFPSRYHLFIAYFLRFIVPSSSKIIPSGNFISCFSKKDFLYNLETGQTAIEKRKSSVRSKVENVFHIVKDIFRWRKVRYPKGVPLQSQRTYPRPLRLRAFPS